MVDTVKLCGLLDAFPDKIESNTALTLPMSSWSDDDNLELTEGRKPTTYWEYKLLCSTSS
eukprot:scaffold672762_cov65-Prasinocladus_malaysianus.AAC.1